MACKTTASVLKELRDAGLKGQQLKDARALLEAMHEEMLNDQQEPQYEDGPETYEAATRGSYEPNEGRNIGNEIQAKIDSGEYRQVENGPLSFLEGISNKAADLMIDAKAKGHYISTDYIKSLLETINSVSEMLNEHGKDAVYNFEIYDTDEYFSKAYWIADTESKNDGEIAGGRIVILQGKDGGSMISSTMETFIHEIMHSIAEHALANDHEVLRDITRLQKQVMKQMTADMLLQDIEYPTATEVKRAEDIIRYMKASSSEFLAYARSNPNVFDAINRMSIDTGPFEGAKGKADKDIGAFDKSLDIMKKVANSVVTAYSTGNKAGAAISNTFNEIIRKNVEVRSGEYSTVEEFSEWQNTASDQFKKIDSFMKDKNEKIAEKMKEIKLLDVSTVEKIAEYIEKITDIAVLKTIKNAGVLQSLLFDLLTDTKSEQFTGTFQIIRQLNSENNILQNDAKTAAITKVDDWFKDVPVDERNAVTDMFRASWATLGIEEDEYSELLSNPELLDSKIADMRTKVKHNEYVNQAMYLGYYMSTGEVKIHNLQKNGYRIYNRKYDNDSRFAIEISQGNAEQKINDIEKLAALYAAKYMKAKSKIAIVNLIGKKITVENATSGEKTSIVKLATALHSESVAAEKGDLRSFSPVAQLGYVRTNSLREVRAEIVGEDMLAYKRASGLTEYEQELSAAEVAGMIQSGDIVTGEMTGKTQKYYLMVGLSYEQTRTQGGLNDIGVIDKMATLQESMDKESDYYITNDQVIENQFAIKVPIEKKINDDSVEALMAMPNQMSQVLDLTGKIVNYGMEIPLEIKDAYMYNNNDVASALGTTISHIGSKRASIINNMRLINHLLDESDKHKDDDNYVVLRASTAEDKKLGVKNKYEEEWAMIPEQTRIYIYNANIKAGVPKSEANQIRIHKNMINNIVGYKDATFANAKVGELFDMKNHPMMRAKVEWLGYYWSKVIGKYKQLVVMVTPEVVFGNAASNMNVAFVHGIGPKEYVSKFKTKWIELEEYGELNVELQELLIEQRAGIKGLETKIADVRKRIKLNPFDDLVKDGQFNLMMEDIDQKNRKEDHVEYNMSKLFGKAGRHEGRVRSVVDTLSISKTTTFYKQWEKATLYNDILNRAIIKEKMLFDLDKRRKAGETMNYVNEKQKIMDYIDQLFVNYSYLDNKMVKYANDVGALMFTKYFFRAAKTIKQMYETNPAGLTTLLAAGAFLDVPNPAEAYMNGPVDSLANKMMFVGQNDPQSIITRIFTPQLSQFVPGL